MKKNTSIIIVFALTLIVAILLIFLITEKKQNLETEETNQYIASSNIKEIKKVESDREITYIIEDHANNLTYSWTFEKNEEYMNSIKENIKLEMDLGLDIITNSTNTTIDKLVSNDDKLIIEFSHHGQLPTKATIRLQVGQKYADGEKLYLYYLNEETNKIEFISDEIFVTNGYVEFSIDHCSSYFLTATIVQEAVNNPKNVNIVIAVMGIVIIILIASMLFNKSDK